MAADDFTQVGPDLEAKLHVAEVERQALANSLALNQKKLRGMDESEAARKAAPELFDLVDQQLARMRELDERIVELKGELERHYLKHHRQY